MLGGPIVIEMGAEHDISDLPRCMFRSRLVGVPISAEPPVKAKAIQRASPTSTNQLQLLPAASRPDL